MTDPFHADPLVTLYRGDCLDVMRQLPDDSVDAVVTDPPYGLEFMGRDWDKLGATTEVAAEGADVSRPSVTVPDESATASRLVRCKRGTKPGPPKPSESSSEAETLLAAQLEQAGIPFEREYRFHPLRKWRADFLVAAFDGTAVLVEIDGGAFIAGRHSRGTGVEKDAEKQSAAAILGYRVIRATPRQVEDGRCLQWIRQALGLEEAA